MFYVCSIFLFSLLFNHNSYVNFKVISLLNITIQPTSKTNKTVGSEKKTYNCYQLPCYIVSTMIFIFVIYILDHLLYQYVITASCFDFKSIHSDLFFLGEFTHNIKFKRQTIYLSRHNVLDIFLVEFRLLLIWPVNKSDTMC